MIVMKFGGTSVEDATAIERVSEIVRDRLKHHPVVVVSALARVTDQLQTMARAAADEDLESALSLARSTRDRHYTTASHLLPRLTYEQFRTGLAQHFDQLERLLRGIAAVGELSLRTNDYVLSFGELVSSAIVDAAFRARGIEAVLVDSRQCIVTDAQHTRAVPLFEETNQRLTGRLSSLLEHGRVPVMGGFIGATRDRVTTTIGRGGSDFSAAIVGAALNASRIEIWTDVDGMRTTDPNLCPDAQRLAEVSFDEAAEMAYFGAKVLHPATLVPAIQKNIPVYVLNSRNPRSRGTCVRAHARRSKAKIKAIAAKRNVTIVTVRAARMLATHGFLHDVFQAFKRHQVAVDTVSTSEVSVSLTVDSKVDLGNVVADLRAFTEVETEPGKAIICVIGENLRGTPGMLARVFGAISNVNVRMVSQGASEINISFVIEERDVPQAVRQLHALVVAPAGDKHANSKAPAVVFEVGDQEETETAGA
jgi:aspartate kinase